MKRRSEVDTAEQVTSSKRVRFNSTSNVEFKYEKEPEIFGSTVSFFHTYPNLYSFRPASMLMNLAGC